MLVLALDTCQAACSAVIMDGAREISRRVEQMSRGHQERLAPMVQELMIEAGFSFGALERVGATVGPGSFTGLRVGLAFAKGLGFALGIPVIGVGVLEALAAPLKTQAGVVVAVLEAKRGQVYVQAFQGDGVLLEPQALAVDAAVARIAGYLRAGPVALVGTGMDHFAALGPELLMFNLDHVDPAVVAQLAQAKPVTAPQPLYLRAPDAKLPGGKDLPA